MKKEKQKKIPVELRSSILLVIAALTMAGILIVYTIKGMTNKPIAIIMISTLIILSAWMICEMKKYMDRQK